MPSIGEDAVDEQVTLASYADQVRELIHHDRNDEAIAICKHVLRYYPKYIDAYRQMGEALLEKREYDGAKDAFQRVLSADPENAIAYVGLATVFEQEQLVNEAVWNMERAFELAPGNSELQKELVRLYNEVDVKAHARAKLTPGALARIYARDGLFSQAIQEFRAIIAGTPSRFDIRVALAETLWRMGRLSEAAQVAQSILEQLPYCLKANLILGAAWHETGLAESDVYLQRAQMLDPLNQVATRMLGAHSPLPAPHTTVPRYVEGVESFRIEPAAIGSPPASMFGEMMETPADFAPTEPTIQTALPEEPATPITADDSLPAWLRRSPIEEAEKTESPREETADWVSQLRELPLEETGTPSPPAPSIDWLNVPKTEPSAQLEPPDEQKAMPTWLDSTPPASTAERTTTELMPGDQSPQATPDWMQGLPSSGETAAPAPAEPAPTTSEELPSWIAPAESATAPAEEIPTWLASPKPVELPVVQEQPPTQTVTEQPTPQEAMHVEEPAAQREELPVEEPAPDWISKLEEPTPSPAEPSTQRAETSVEEPAPDWISKLEEPTPIPAEPSTRREELPAEEPVPDWMSKLEEPAPVPVSQSTELPGVGFELPPLAEPEPVAVPPQAPSIVVELPPSPPVETIVVETPVAPVEPKRKRQPKGYGHLVQARAHRDAHRWNDALTEYDYLVQHAPRLVREVIDDLEVLIQRIDVPLEAHRILGDAYTRVDRLAEALERYRFVLEHVS
jgi:Flp pilus assembly protein TadD